MSGSAMWPYCANQTVTDYMRTHAGGSAVSRESRKVPELAGVRTPAMASGTVKITLLVHSFLERSIFRSRDEKCAKILARGMRKVDDVFEGMMSSIWPPYLFCYAPSLCTLWWILNILFHRGFGVPNGKSTWAVFHRVIEVFIVVSGLAKIKLWVHSSWIRIGRKMCWYFGQGYAKSRLLSTFFGAWCLPFGHHIF